MESLKRKLKSDSQKGDRVVLENEALIVLGKMITQIRSEFGDLIRVTQKDLINFLMTERISELSHSELQKLKSLHFDLVRALKVATTQASKAKTNGTEINLNEVLKLLQTQSVSENSSSPRTSGRKKKEKMDAGSNAENSIAQGSLNPLGEPYSGFSLKHNSESKTQNNSKFIDQTSS
ncbi:MAG: hypothetical protein ACK5P5_00075 [Pseudobdellovibrionaceae bacterium]